MIDRGRLFTQLSIEEAIKRFPYDDATGKRVVAKGKITIAIGRNLSDKPLSDAAIRFLFDEDVNEAVAGLTQFVPTWEKHSEPRRRALVDLVFNLGIGGLLEFKKFLAFMDAGAYPQAARELASAKWALQVGDGPGGRFDRAERLERMIETGEDFAR